jgi:hypothetical protein
MALTFSVMKSTPSTATARTPAAAMATAVSAIASESLILMWGHVAAAAARAPWTSGSM